MLRRVDLNERTSNGAEPPRASSLPNIGGEESVIGPDDFFSGSYSFARGVRIQGRVEGAIESRGHIVIEEQAQVTGDIVAREVTVAGRYDGRTVCRGRFRITPTGFVTGEINTNLLIIEEGGYFGGELRMKERVIAGRHDEL